MPRRDRRFTGEDVKRLYCKNLTPQQRHYFDLLDCDWSDYSAEEKVKQFLEELKDSGLLDELVDLIPGGVYVRKLLLTANALLEFGELKGIDLIPTIEWKSTLDELFNIKREYKELDIINDALLLGK